MTFLPWSAFRCETCSPWCIWTYTWMYVSTYVRTYVYTVCTYVHNTLHTETPRKAIRSTKHAYVCTYTLPMAMEFSQTWSNHVRIYSHTHTCRCTYVLTHTKMDVRVYVHTYVHRHTSVHTGTYVHRQIYICMHIRTYVRYIRTYVHRCMYLHTYVDTCSYT